MTLASATLEERSPVTFLNWREEARHDSVPFALLTMPEPQFGTPAKRTDPVVWSWAHGTAAPMPTFPLVSMPITWFSVAPFQFLIRNSYWPAPVLTWSIDPTTTASGESY